jgi:hypothetical protein
MNIKHELRYQIELAKRKGLEVLFETSNDKEYNETIYCYPIGCISDKDDYHVCNYTGTSESIILDLTEFIHQAILDTSVTFETIQSKLTRVFNPLLDKVKQYTLLECRPRDNNNIIEVKLVDYTVSNKESVVYKDVFEINSLTFYNISNQLYNILLNNKPKVNENRRTK